jgi:hypothetical protein
MDIKEVYEFTDHSNKVDENVLVVDFGFSSTVTIKEAIDMVDKMVEMLDDSTDATAKEFMYHKPKLFAVSQFIEKEENE